MGVVSADKKSGRQITPPATPPKIDRASAAQGGRFFPVIRQGTEVPLAFSESYRLFSTGHELWHNESNHGCMGFRA